MVVLAAAIDAGGRVRELKVVNSLDPVLDRRAIDAVRQWQFSPARMSGLPVPVLINVTVNFNLD
jgi:protein TonB